MMDNAARLSATRFVAVLAAILMVTSYGTYKLGVAKELYPFFYWRLFSVPMGWDGGTAYRLYTRAEPDAPWHRQPLAPIHGYGRKDYQYQWGSLVRAALADSLRQTEAHERLRTFAQVVAPDAVAYRVVAERFHPLELLDDPSRYDTVGVLLVTQ